MITHPLRAGGQFPPPHTSIFVDGVSSLEPCTWGILLDEAAWIWDKYDVTSPLAGRGEYGTIGQIQRTRSVSPYPPTRSSLSLCDVRKLADAIFRIRPFATRRTLTWSGDRSPMQQLCSFFGVSSTLPSLDSSKMVSIIRRLIRATGLKKFTGCTTTTAMRMTCKR